MAHITFHAPRVAHIDLGAIVRTKVAEVKEALARRAEYRAVYNELAAMTDRDLADIGISRGMIEDVAHQAACKN
jgi:uncharacterized protein YjiS (DUF1127 family)